MSRTFLPLVAALLLAGCATIRPAAPARAGDGIHHIVLITLHDPGDADALIADCERLLPAIPAVSGFWCGRTLDVGRAGVLQDFHVGLYVHFADEAAYAEYVDHANHVGLVDDWRPRVAVLAVRDVRR